MCRIANRISKSAISYGLVVFSLGFALVNNQNASASCFMGLFKGNSADPVTKLNAYLVDNEPTDFLYANLVVAEELEKSLSNQLQLFNDKKKSLLDVTRKFVALKQINRDNMCNEGIEILNELSASLRTYGKKPFKGPESRRRLNMLVRQRATKHFKACFKSMDLAWDKLEKLHARENPPMNLSHKLRSLTNLTDEITYYQFFSKPLSKHDNMQASLLIKQTDRDLSVEALRISLDKLVKQDTQIDRIREVDKKSGELVRTEETVLKFVDKYFWAPCEYLIRDLDEDRKDLLDRAFKLIYAANLVVNYELYADYYFSNLLEWTANLSTCRRLFLRPSKEALAKQINWSQILG